MAQILLVEPDQLLAKTYAAGLTYAGHNVVAARTAQSAVQAADALQPDLVVLELQLVEHSGVEFLYEFRSYSEWQNVPVMIHSHVPPAEFNSHLQLLKDELGVQVYLYKPATSLQFLLETVTDQLALAGAPS
ncbi:MAG TPA: response regulator [Candidatus Saccharimonadales bacterium]|nr:response regulator [Candidatus Saccharimonadales bacterium]